MHVSHMIYNQNFRQKETPILSLQNWGYNVNILKDKSINHCFIISLLDCH